MTEIKPLMQSIEQREHLDVTCFRQKGAYDISDGTERP